MDSSIQSAIVATAQSAGVDPNLALAVAQQESGGNQSKVSPAGAIGVFQLMPGTAEDLGVNPYDTLDNIRGGIAYLAQQISTFGGDLSKALAAFNWGPSALSAAIRQWGSNWLNYAPAETRTYVAAILSALGISSLTVTPGQAPAASTTPFPWGYALAGAGALGILLLALT